MCQHFFLGTAEHKPVLETNSIPENYLSRRHNDNQYVVTFGVIAYPLIFSSFFCFISLLFLFIYFLFPTTWFSNSLSEHLKSGIHFHTSRMCDILTLIQELSNILPLGYTELDYCTACMWYMFNVPKRDVLRSYD
jgi:hypothetical protein